jgi:hypothetical protein
MQISKSKPKKISILCTFKMPKCEIFDCSDCHENLTLGTFEQEASQYLLILITSLDPTNRPHHFHCLYLHPSELIKLLCHWLRAKIVSTVHMYIYEALSKRIQMVCSLSTKVLFSIPACRSYLVYD